MPEHRIRLRGGWELLADDGATTVPLSLPTSWPPRVASRRLRLVRRFGAPAADRVRLALEAVDGLRALTLNGAPIALDPGTAAPLVVDMPPLRERNVLTLDVELAGSSNDPTAPWGCVALVVVEAAGSGDSQ